MAKKIVIDPVTRIEGHARITIHMNDKNEVDDAQFHVTQLRGFEKLSEGRPFREMPSLMARICGICPVSHLVASAKACDELLAVRIPPTASRLREVVNLGQLVQSHALSFFHLSSPDLLLGMDADPARRNILGVLEDYPDLARAGIRLRQFGQQIIERLAGKRIHPAWIVPGGVSAPLSREVLQQIQSEIPEMIEITQKVLEWFRPTLDNFRDEIRTFASEPTMWMGLVTPQNTLAHYDGMLKLVAADGTVINPAIPPTDYQSFIGEAVEPYSFLKTPYYLPMGYPEGVYRVGPLARLNIVDSCGTPLADAEHARFKQLPLEERHSSFHYHYTRLIEILYGIERIAELLNDPTIISPHIFANAQANSYEGVGISEAPRGTLLHHYRIDDNGLIIWANLIIATGNNNLAMNRGVKQVAKEYVKGKDIKEGMLNRVEAVIRTFDPCLSCSTHAVGQMPMQVEIYDADGEMVRELRR